MILVAENVYAESRKRLWDKKATKNWQRIGWSGLFSEALRKLSSCSQKKLILVVVHIVYIYIV
jgi:hypothetical protein